MVGQLTESVSPRFGFIMVVIMIYLLAMLTYLLVRDSPRGPNK